mmetsp:Transcript_95347/g.269567  ORF Transcript_95347/g.269567 Transcript_95347/m.269567 type:complete len:228 (-) Transcript_95347:413-1096(-)
MRWLWHRRARRAQEQRNLRAEVAEQGLRREGGHAVERHNGEDRPDDVRLPLHHQALRDLQRRADAVFAAGARSRWRDLRPLQPDAFLGQREACQVLLSRRRFRLRTPPQQENRVPGPEARELADQRRRQGEAHGHGPREGTRRQDLYHVRHARLFRPRDHQIGGAHQGCRLVDTGHPYLRVLVRAPPFRVRQPHDDLQEGDQRYQQGELPQGLQEPSRRPDQGLVQS